MQTKRIQPLKRIQHEYLETIKELNDINVKICTKSLTLKR